MTNIKTSKDLSLEARLVSVDSEPAIARGIERRQNVRGPPKSGSGSTNPSRTDTKLVRTLYSSGVERSFALGASASRTWSVRIQRGRHDSGPVGRVTRSAFSRDAIASVNKGGVSTFNPCVVV